MSIDYRKAVPAFRPPADAPADRPVISAADLRTLESAERAFTRADRDVMDAEANNADRTRKPINARPLYSARLALARALARVVQRVTGR